MSHSSRQHTSNKELNDEKDYFEFAQEKFSNGIDYVIVGHSHKPLIKKINHGFYINLGNWIIDNSYALLENGNISLNYWNQ